MVAFLKITMIKIRPASIKDAKKIAFIKNITWKNTYKTLIDLSYLNKLKTSQQVIEKWQARIAETKNKHTYLWIALKSNQIVGFLWAGQARDPRVENLKFEIYAFYVLPEYQHQGIGKKLFTTFVNTVKNNFFLWMLKDNKSRLAYEKLRCFKTDYKNTITIGGKQYQEIAFIYKFLQPNQKI